MRNKTKILVLLACLGPSLGLRAQDSGRIELSLEEALNCARQNNIELKNSRLELKAARLQKDEVFTEYFPKLNAMAMSFYAMDPLLEISITDILGNNDFAWGIQEKAQELAGTYGINTSYSAFKSGYSTSISIMQPLFAGGRIVNGNKLAALGVKASELKLSIQERKSAEEIEKAWWEIASLEEKIENLKYLNRSLETIHGQLKGAVASGLSSESELLELEVKRNELKIGIKQAESGVKLLKLNLLNNIGLKYVYADSLSLKRESVEAQTPDFYYRDPAEIVSNMEESQLLDLQVKAKQMEKKISIGESLPQLAIGATAGYSDLYNKAKFNSIAFATLQIPISDWAKTSKKAKRIQTEIEKAENEREYIAEQLQLLVAKLWLDLNSSYDQWQLKQQALNTCQRLYEIALSNYGAGLIPLQELLQAESKFHQASVDKSDALIAYRNAIIAYTGLINK